MSTDKSTTNKCIQQIIYGKFGLNAKFLCSYIKNDIKTLDILSSQHEYDQIYANFIRCCNDFYYNTIANRSSKSIGKASTSPIQTNAKKKDKEQV